MRRPYRASVGLYIVSGELVSVRAAAGKDGRAAFGAERDRLVDRLAEGEAVREPGGEAVAAAVRVGDRPGERRGAKRPAGADPAAESTGRRDGDLRLRVELAGLESLGRVLAAADEHVQRHGAPAQRREAPSRGDEHVILQVTTPTRLVWGDRDALVDPAYAKRWRELIPGAQGEVVSIEGAGHMVPYERPDELADAVLAFLGAPAAVRTP